MHPAQVSPLELIVSSSSAATRRPSVRSPPKRRPTCPRARTPPRSDRGAHLTRVSALPGPGISPVSGQLSRTASRGSQLIVSRFPAAFRPPALASRVILFPPGNWAFLTVGLPGTTLVPGPGRGYHVPHLRDTTGMGAPSTPGTAVLAPARCRARPSPAASQRPVPAPRNRIPPAGLLITGHQRGFTRFTRPACPSPVAPPMGREALGLFPVLRTPPLPAAHDRAGPGVSTRPELRDRHHRPSNPRVHSQSATSCRNGRCGRLWRPA